MHSSAAIPLDEVDRAPAELAPSRSALLLGQSHARLWLLAGIVALHAILCVWFHWDRAFLGDEWGSFHALNTTYSDLLTRFFDWRTMNFYLAGLKFIHDVLGGTNWLLVLPGILAGCWLVVTTSRVALRLGAGMQTALVAALLIATNPLIVSYAVTIRSYILLVAFIAAMFLSLLNWKSSGRWRDGMLCGFWGGLALLMHLNAVYSFMAIAIVGCGWTWQRLLAKEPDSLKRLLRLAIPCAFFTGLAAAAHLPMYKDIQTFRSAWSAPAPIPLTFLPTVADMFFGSGFTVIPAMAALLYGAFRAVSDRSGSRVLLAMAIVPVAAISLAGVSHYPTAYSRFLIAIVPMLILIAAYGMGTARTGLATAGACVLLAAMVGCQVKETLVQWHLAHGMPFRHIAEALPQTPCSRTVLLGSDIHSLAFRYSGVTLQRNLVQALSSAPKEAPFCLNILDPGSYVPAAGVTLGRMRVLQFVGTPTDVADRLIAMWSDRVDHTQKMDDRTQYVASQLAAVLQWRGNRALSAKYLQISQKAVPAADRRIR